MLYKPALTIPHLRRTGRKVQPDFQLRLYMLKKSAFEEGKDWDCLITLFAYCEVPHESSCSPFEMLYDRDVHGPLDILKETWEADNRSDQTLSRMS